MSSSTGGGTTGGRKPAGGGRKPAGGGRKPAGGGRRRVVR